MTEREGKRLCIDLFCGLGGWAEGFLSEDYWVVGFDIERHDYGTGAYPGDFVMQDVLTLHGKQFKDAAVMRRKPASARRTATARCLPWKRAKSFAATGQFTLRGVLSQFSARRLKLLGGTSRWIVENVCGAQKWVGRAGWHFGSYYLWGDIPALMPFARSSKVPGFRFDGSGGSFQTASVNSIKNNGLGSWFAIGSPGQKVTGQNPDGRKVPGQDWSRFAKTGEVSPHWRMEATKNEGGSWFNQAHNTTSGKGKNPVSQRKQVTGNGRGWFGKYEQGQGSRNYSSKSSARKRASAEIAKIPFPLAQHIAKVFKERGNYDSMPTTDLKLLEIYSIVVPSSTAAGKICSLLNWDTILEAMRTANYSINGSLLKASPMQLIASLNWSGPRSEATMTKRALRRVWLFLRIVWRPNPYRIKGREPSCR